MEPALKSLAKMVNAMGKADNIPYTILGCLALVSLLARITLMLR
jgi:hypothetical protein